MNQTKMTVGRTEWCSLPDISIPAIKARVDTGAQTSSIHAFDIRKFRREGKPWVSFEVHPLEKNRSTIVRCEMPVIERKTVKSSNGMTEVRYTVETALKLGGRSWNIHMTLTNRDSMGYRMLLGREALEGRVVVDPSLCLSLGNITADDLESYYGGNRIVGSGLKIGVLATNPELYSNRRIIEAGRERGHEMEFLTIRHCYMQLDSEEPEVRYRGDSSLSNMDAVITRIRPSMTFYGCAVARQFESMGILAVNSAQSIAQARDKLHSLQLMVSNKINIPKTGFANSPTDTEDLIDLVGGAPAVVKLLEGTQGRGVVLAETNKAAESVINAMKTLKANLLVQEFIKEAQGSDLRCFVINGKVVASIQRQAAPGEFRANLHLGAKPSVAKIDSEEKSMAVKAAKLLGLNFAGVDIIRSDRGPLLLEVNSSPGLEGVEDATGKDIAGMMISTIEKKLRWAR